MKMQLQELKDEITRLWVLKNQDGRGDGFYFLIWPPSWKEHITVSAHFSQINWQ
jgi:hypothetical protein